LIKPKALQIGDVVAIIATSSPTDAAKVDKAIASIKGLGLFPIIYPSCYKKHGHLAGEDDERLQDFHDAFKNPLIKGIICLKGGAGSTRLLSKIDFKCIENNPKIFVGYSDVTALHVAINKICRMVTYHGPMALSDLFILENDTLHFEPFTLDSYQKNLFTSMPIGKIANPEGYPLKVLVEGVAEGELIGGNLSLLISTLGSPFEIDVKGKILFIEDTNEACYVVDRMLTALALAGKFEECAGIILGTWSGCKAESKTSYEGSDLTLEIIFEEVIKPFNKPTLMNLQSGHSSPHITLAFGTRVRINTKDLEICFLESGNQ